MIAITRRLPSLFARLALLAAVSFGTTAAFADEQGSVSIKNFMFEPMSLTVHPGTTVTWKNLDGEPHLVVAVDGSFRSPALDQGDSYHFRFDKAGTYAIFCGIHPSMKATIVVK